MPTDAPDLEKKMAEADRRYGLFPEGDFLGVAVSGGADSMALLHALARLGRQRSLRLSVLHMHHGMRGRSADADARFVCSVCERLKIPCEVGHADVVAEARAKRLSLEMAGREARYRFFREMRQRLGFSRVVLAHTADDQVETILLKLLRGTGPRGLAGMSVQSVVQGVPVVRPLLTVTRGEVEFYLRALGEGWREDRSNRDRTFLRNRIRHHLLPLLERRYNPRIRSVLLRMAGIFQEEERWWEGTVEEALARAGQDRLRTERLKEMPLALRRRVWRLWMMRAGVPESVLDYDLLERMETQLERGDKGTVEIEVGAGWHLRISYGYWELLPPGQVRADLPLPMVSISVPGETVIPDWGIRVRVKEARGYPSPLEPGPGRFPCRVYVDAEKLNDFLPGELVLRSWKPGDRIGVGEGRTKKIQDILTEARVPRPVRSRIPLLVVGAEVLWVAGGPPSFVWRVSSSRARSWLLEMDRLPQESVATGME